MILARRRFLRSGLGAASAAILPAVPVARATSLAGNEDQTQRLQILIDAATRQGIVALLPLGRFRCGTLTLPEGAMVAGSAGRTILFGSGAAPLIAAKGSRRLRLSGLALEAPSAVGAALIEAADCARLEIEDCRMQGGRNGARLERCGGAIARSVLTDQGDSAIFAADSQNLAIRDNEVTGCGNNGIQVWRSAKGHDGTIVEGNTISAIRFDQGGNGPYGNGVGLFRAGGVRVSGNRISDCALTAIRNNGGANVNITGNHCRRLGETAIYVEFAYDGAVVAQNIVEDALSGISITNLDQGGYLSVCAGNLLRRLRRGRMPYGGDVDGGIGIYAEADCAVTGNVVEDAEGFGLLLGWGPYLRNLTATGNVLRGCGVGIGVSLAGSERAATISGNAIAGAARGAIIGMEWAKPVTGDLAKSADPRAKGLAIVGNVVS